MKALWLILTAYYAGVVLALVRLYEPYHFGTDHFITLSIAIAWPVWVLLLPVCAILEVFR